MKILIYSHYFSPSVGGAERVVESLARGLAERGHQVTVATQTPAPPAADSGLPYRVVRQPGFMQLVRRIRQHDLVHLAGPALLPMFLAWLLSRPAVIEHHVYQAICPNGLLLHQPSLTVCPGHFQAGRHRECLRCNAGSGRWKSFRMWASAFPRLWLCKRAACRVAVSNHALRRLALPRSRVIYHGVPPIEPTSSPTADAAKQSWPISFAFVGRFVKEKGLPVLLDAATLLQRQGYPFRLKLIGDGPERPSVEDVVKDRGLQESVTFTGMLDAGALRSVTEGIGVLIMPSIWEETAGMSAIEQMMSGRAVITADIGGLGEVVEDAGLRFPPGDPKALAVCMRRVSEEPGLTARLGLAARHRALALFTRERMIGEHERLYASILNSQSR
jgi:glycogen(starch) synthase